MGKITLNEALKKASVKNDLQMFLGLDAQSELGGMTPERLAAVAGESIGVATALKAGLVPPELAISTFSNQGSKVVEIEHTDSYEWRTISFYLTISREGVSDALFYVSGVSSTGSTSVKVKCIFSLNQPPVSFYYRRNEDKTVSIYCAANSNATFGSSRFTKRPNCNGSKKSSSIVEVSDLNLESLTKIDVIR